MTVNFNVQVKSDIDSLVKILIPVSKPTAQISQMAVSQKWDDNLRIWLSTLP